MSLRGKLERERQKQYGLIRLDSDILEDMERERRTFQLQMCEVVKVNRKCLGHVLCVWFGDVFSLLFED